MTLLESLAPAQGALLGLELGGPFKAAVAAQPFDWLPLSVGGTSLGESAVLPPQDGFERSVQLWRTEDRLSSIELHVGLAREKAHLLDALEKQVKAQLRARLGPYSKDKLREPRPHWLEPGDRPRLWLVLRWVTPEAAWMKVCTTLA